jgi:hypothetical protein
VSKNKPSKDGSQKQLFLICPAYSSTLKVEAATSSSEPSIDSNGLYVIIYRNIEHFITTVVRAANAALNSNHPTCNQALHRRSYWLPLHVTRRITQFNGRVLLKLAYEEMYETGWHQASYIVITRDFILRQRRSRRNSLLSRYIV